MFRSTISMKRLALLCRSLSTALHSGVPVVRSFELAAKKTHDRRLRHVMNDVVTQLKSGEDVATALRSHEGYFPTLTVDMVNVAEHTGALPEVLRSLAEHYENNLRLRRDFLGLIALPAIQFTAAIFVIAGLIFFLGLIAGSSGSEPLDVLGFGLTGAEGALMWLGGWAMGLASVYIAYRLIVSSLQGQKAVHQALMAIPVIGGCMRSFAVARFSWAYHLTQQAGMPVDEIIEDVVSGELLTDALANSHLFPEEFIETVHVAETSGTVPEALHRLSPQFEDQARRSLRTLAIFSGWAVWAGVAAFIVFLIFRVVLWYTGMLSGFVDEAMGG